VEGSSGQTEPFINLGLVHEEEAVGSTSALVWSPGKRVVLHGQLQSDQEGEVKVSLHLRNCLTSGRVDQTYVCPQYVDIPLVSTGRHPVELVYPERSYFPGSRAFFRGQVGQYSYSIGSKLMASFIPRLLDVKMGMTSEKGYVGEQVPVVINIRNDDDRKLFLRLSVFLPPGEEEQGKSRIIIWNER
jgi:hypothetical protein